MQAQLAPPPGCSALVASTAYRAVTSAAVRTVELETAAMQLGCLTLYWLTLLLLPIFAWSLLEESCNTMRVYIWSS